MAFSLSPVPVRRPVTCFDAGQLVLTVIPDAQKTDANIPGHKVRLQADVPSEAQYSRGTQPGGTRGKAKQTMQLPLQRVME